MAGSRLGLTPGKFAPLHKGHQLLIETALAEGGHQRSELPIRLLTNQQRLAVVAGLISAVLVVGWLFSTYTDAHIPFWDAAVSGMSVVAQILLMRKKLEIGICGSWLMFSRSASISTKRSTSLPGCMSSSSAWRLPG